MAAASVDVDVDDVDDVDDDVVVGVAVVVGVSAVVVLNMVELKGSSGLVDGGSIEDEGKVKFVDITSVVLGNNGELENICVAFVVPFIVVMFEVVVSVFTQMPY